MSYNEYDYPAIYEAEYGGFKDDFNIFINLKTKGSALDLACGTGRLTEKLANSGLHVTGLDISQSMIDYAIAKSKGLNINYVHGDVQNFRLKHKYDLITMAGNAFQALLTDTDQRAMFACVKAHLKLDGVFVFDTRRPTTDELKTSLSYQHWHYFKLSNGERAQVFGKQYYDKISNRVLYITKRIFTNHETVTRTKLLFTTLNDIKKLVAASGFELMEAYGDVNKNPLSDDNSKIICVCKIDC